MNNRYISELWDESIADWYDFTSDSAYELFECHVHEYSYGQFCIPDLSADDGDRDKALKCLKKALPKSYIFDPQDDSITITTSDEYLQETIKRLQSTNPSMPIENPLQWWQDDVCLYNDILVLYQDEVKTLHEFLLELISISMEEGNRKFYVGCIMCY